MTTLQVPQVGFPKVYSGQFNLAGNANAVLNLQIQNYDFEATFLTAVSQGAFTIQILINNRAVHNVQLFGGGAGTGVRGENMFGTGQNPMPLPVPLKFPKGATVQITITDVSGAGNAGQISFIGREV